MSYFVTVTKRFTVEEFTAKINKLSIGSWVFQFVPSITNVQYTTVIFKFDDYPAYVWFCHKTKRKPVSTEEFFPLSMPEKL
jgi:hypothetical protein